MKPDQNMETDQEQEAYDMETKVSPEKAKKRMKMPGGDRLKTVSYQLTILVRWWLSVVLWGINASIMFFNLVIHVVMAILNVFIDYLSYMASERLPEKRRKKLHSMLACAGVKMRAEKVFGIVLMYSIIFSLMSMIIAISLMDSTLIMVVTVILTFIGVWTLFSMTLTLLTYRRTESVENTLPDILDMIAQNMIAGMTTYNSLWIAAKPEFGPLAEEIQSAAKSTLGGMSLDEALNQIVGRIKSDKLERSITLINQGTKSGGELPTVLQGVARDMRAERYLKKHMATETSGYAAFILFTLLVGTPLLFAISLQFITIFAKLMEETNVDELAASAQVGMMTMTALTITPEFYLKYAIVTVSVLALFGAFLIGLIRTGQPISGLQLIPVLVTLCLGIFFLLTYVLNAVFSKMMPI